MAFINNPTTNLSRFSIGEVQDLSAVPVFYDAGSSKWLRSGTATAASNLSTTAKALLTSAGTPGDPTVLLQSSLSSSYNVYGFYATYPIERISASNISVVPSRYLGTTAVGVGVVTSAGVQAVSTGQISNRAGNLTQGSNAVVAGNGTTIFSYCFTSATVLNVSSTTNGTTWTAGVAATGVPVFASDAGTIAHASASTSSDTIASMAGWKRRFNLAAAGQFAVFWCGARFLVLGPGVGQVNYVASLSANGTAFGGDNTVAVLGATVRATTSNVQFYRNGNNCFLAVSLTNRFSTDGGVTWAACTGAGAGLIEPGTGYLQVNTTDPAKLFFKLNEVNTIAYYSADSGASWSASRPVPYINLNGGFYYKGSTIVASDGGTNYSVSTDDGVTFVAPTFPIGVLSTTIKFFADANRFYAGVSGQAQILTSSDAVTWTLITLPQNFNLTHEADYYGFGIMAFDSNTVVLLGNSTVSVNNWFCSTTNGGVTWTAGQFTVANLGLNWGVGSAFVTPDGGGVGFAFGMSGLTSGQNTSVFKSDITAGGAFYRTGATAITPTKTGAFAYVRVD